MNTIVDRPRRRQLADLRGINTDYAAILDRSPTQLGITREQLADYRVAVIGAGGTGRTAVAALAHYGATVVVYNRTKERADALAAEFNGQTRQGRRGADGEALRQLLPHLHQHDVASACTRTSTTARSASAPPKFTPDTLVFDTVYNPMETKLLKQAEAAGAKTIGGVEMFVRQAARQFEAWTGKPAPLDMFRRVVEARFARRSVAWPSRPCVLP